MNFKYFWMVHVKHMKDTSKNNKIMEDTSKNNILWLWMVHV
jgi:hypothetical protein